MRSGDGARLLLGGVQLRTRPAPRGTRCRYGGGACGRTAVVEVVVVGAERSAPTYYCSAHRGPGMELLGRYVRDGDE